MIRYHKPKKKALDKFWNVKQSTKNKWFDGILGWPVAFILVACGFYMVPLLIHSFVESIGIIEFLLFIIAGTLFLLVALLSLNILLKDRR
jgi:hypothetical protein